MVCTMVYGLICGLVYDLGMWYLFVVQFVVRFMFWVCGLVYGLVFGCSI